jgi:hypothetical protein
MSETGIQMRRVWAMPNAETFSVEPIHNFVWKYLSASKVSIDPFARNKRWATYTNDLNPDTEAEYHMDAEEFLKMLADRGEVADLVVIDPPYSPRQVKECYDGIGMKMKQDDALLGKMRSQLRQEIDRLVPEGGVVLWFGWNSTGMGAKYGFQMEEVVLVCHGSDHNDTICMAERRIQQRLFQISSPATSNAYVADELAGARKESSSASRKGE